MTTANDNAGAIYATPEGLAAAQRLKDAPLPSPRDRLRRAACSVLSLEHRLERPATGAEFAQSAAWEAEAAIRNMDAARSENDPQRQLVWLERAGLYARNALALQAKAREVE
jgi:hypothetical protein